MTNDAWLKTSIMAKRGLAKGQAGNRHRHCQKICTCQFFHIRTPFSESTNLLFRTVDAV